MQRLLLSVTAAMTALVLLAGSVNADTELGHTGKVGNHLLRDSPTKDAGGGYYTSPGVNCKYDYSSNKLVALAIQPPEVWARNLTSARDYQYVAWRAIVKRVAPGNVVATFYKTAKYQQMAWDDQFASFAGVNITPSFPANDQASYYVNIKMFWIRNGSVEGTALHRIDYYNEQIPPYASHALNGSCPAVYIH